MRTLIIGKGGREHALVKALKKSPSVTALFAAPGNAGMAKDCEIASLDTQNHSLVTDFCKSQDIEMVIIGPEAELVSGLADAIRNEDILCFGPSKDAAKLEASKIFCKEFLQEFNIPTANSKTVSTVSELKNCVDTFTTPYVLKADGLCAGKGVYICKTKEELFSAGKELFEDKIFGEAGSKALLEQFQPGYEISLHYITNGESFHPLPLCQDHKRIFENDEGPNTGGMGVVGPMTINDDLQRQIEAEILAPIQSGFKQRSFDFRGVLFIGLMITKDGPIVLEFNVRFGDPETQVIMPLLDGDWGQVLQSIARGQSPVMNWKNEFAACVVLAAENYPGSPVKNINIEGDLKTETDNSYFIHAGTKLKDDQFVVDGGRVLNAIGTGLDMRSAVAQAYSQAEKAQWKGRQMRLDIGAKAVTRHPS